MPAPSSASAPSLPSFLRRQESTRPAISRAPSTFTTSRPSRVTTPSDIHSALKHLSRAWIPACCPFRHSCGPFRHSCAGRNPRDLPSRARPPRSRHRVQAASQRRRTSIAPSNICRAPGFLPAAPSVIPGAPSVIPAQAGIHATCHLARSLHVHDVASKPRHNAVGHPQRPQTSVARLDSCLRPLPSFLAPLPSFLRRQESTRPTISRAPSTLSTSRPSHATTPSGINSALEHLSLGWIPACGPFRHSCAGRNPRDLPSRVRPPRSRRRVQAASQRRLTSTAPANIRRAPGFLPAAPSVTPAAPSVIPAQAGIHATCHLARALHVHDVVSKPRHNAVGHQQRPRTSVARLDSGLRRNDGGTGARIWGNHRAAMLRSLRATAVTTPVRVSLKSGRRSNGHIAP